MRVAPLALAWLLAPAAAAGCRDVTRFSNDGDHYEGAVVQASFVRAGVAESSRMCLVIDGDHLEDAPGAITTDDGRFAAAALRPIPQIWHDPLSTLTFGEGRTKNLLYVVSDVTGADVMAIVSLLQNGTIEVRLLRGAPPVDGGAASGQNVFAVFPLQREKGPCSF